MQNTIHKFRQSAIVFQKPGILSENLKTPYSSSFFGETLHTFPTYQCLQKDIWLIFANNSRSKQNKKTPRHPFVDIGK